MKVSVLTAIFAILAVQLGWAQTTAKFVDSQDAVSPAPVGGPALVDVNQFIVNRQPVESTPPGPIIVPSKPYPAINQAARVSFERPGTGFHLDDKANPQAGQVEKSPFKPASEITLERAVVVTSRTVIENPSPLEVERKFQEAANDPIAFDYFTAPTIPKTWTSPNLGYYPLYFEDENLERYGIGYGCLQNPVSGARFLTDTFFLPYKMCVEPPHQCVYPIGRPRPGNCIPAIDNRPPFSPAGAGFQGLTVLGLGFGL
jgi:hypothetical protein